MNSFSKSKIPLFCILLLSLFLGLKGGFLPNHPDSEFVTTMSNKTYLLHSLYENIARLELFYNQNFLDQYQEFGLKEFMLISRRTSIALYMVGVGFSILGLIGSYALGTILINNLTGLLACLLLGTSFMWSSNLHYPTVDLPVSALCIFSFFIMLKFKIEKKELQLKEKLLIGILIGLSTGLKYAGILLLIPFLILYFDKKNYKKSLIDLSLLSFTGLVIFLLFLSDKLNIFNRIVDQEIHTLYKTGYLGFENSAGHTYLYHLQHSLGNEYGVLLSILGLAGIVFAYKQLSKQNFWGLISFPLAIYLIMGSMVLETPRYIMPALPFLAVFSAIGVTSLVELLNKKLGLKRDWHYCLTSILVLIAISPNLSLSFLHNKLVAEFGTDYNLSKVYYELRPEYDKLILEPLLPLLPYGYRNIKTTTKENLLDCNASQTIDFKQRFFHENKNIIVLDSFWHDRFIYDWHFHCKDTQRKAFSNYADLHIFQVSPFKTDKELVPFSHESRFSPKPPDIYFRKQRGAFYEIIIKDDGLADRFEGLAEKHEVDFIRKTGDASYYLTRIQGFNE